MPSRKGTKRKSSWEILYLSKAVAIFLVFVQWISFLPFIYFVSFCVCVFNLDFAGLGIQAKALHMLGK